MVTSRFCFVLVFLDLSAVEAVWDEFVVAFFGKG